MLATWIEVSAKGRHGGQVRAGMWSAVVIGTHPIEAGQEVWLELSADELPIGPCPAYWIENKGVNSHWHVPIPPQAVNVRLHYPRVGPVRGRCRSPAQRKTRSSAPIPPEAMSPASSRTQSSPEGLVGNRDDDGSGRFARGATIDVFFPTVGLHSDVRPAAGEKPNSRSHFRGIHGGPGDRPPARLVRRADRPGGRSSITRGPRTS